MRTYLGSFFLCGVILWLIEGQSISGGKLVIDVSYFGVHIHSEVHDLCDETLCPISTGDFLIAHSQVLPGFTPPVSHHILNKSM